jgi:hypothetical protein
MGTQTTTARPKVRANALTGFIFSPPDEDSYVAVNLLGADLTNGRYDQLAGVDAVNLTKDIWTANRYQTCRVLLIGCKQRTWIMSHDLSSVHQTCA